MKISNFQQITSLALILAQLKQIQNVRAKKYAVDAKAKYLYSTYNDFKCCIACDATGIYRAVIIIITG